MPSALTYQSLGHTGKTRVLLLTTRREEEVLDLLVTGISDEEIGAHLYISRTTVHAHVWNVQEKVGIHGRHGRLKLVLWWLKRRGWLVETPDGSYLSLAT